MKIVKSIKKVQEKINMLMQNRLKSENLHFTLQFLGKVSTQESYLKSVKALHAIEFSSFDIRFEGIRDVSKNQRLRELFGLALDNEDGRQRC